MEGRSRLSPVRAAAVPTSPTTLVLPFLELLAISGAALSVVSGALQREIVASSDELATRIEELQFELGEGPGFQVVATGLPVQSQPKCLSSSLTPFFDAAARELDVQTIVSLPLKIGAAVVGVVTLYRQQPGLLSEREMSTAAALVHWVSGPAINQAAISAGSDIPNIDDAGRVRREIHQATGMILVQADVSASDAFVRLKAHAFAENKTVEEVAREVISGRLDFRSNLE